MLTRCDVFGVRVARLALECAEVICEHKKTSGSGLNTVRLTIFLSPCNLRIDGVNHGADESDIGYRRAIERLFKRQFVGAGLYARVGVSGA